MHVNNTTTRSNTQHNITDAARAGVMPYVGGLRNDGTAAPAQGATGHSNNMMGNHKDTSEVH
jgi:hypothetical protein